MQNPAFRFLFPNFLVLMIIVRLSLFLRIDVCEKTGWRESISISYNEVSFSRVLELNLKKLSFT